MSTTPTADAQKKRADELQHQYMSMSRIQLMTHLAQLEQRVERLEQARKPGPKPKDSNG